MLNATTQLSRTVSTLGLPLFLFYLQKEGCEGLSTDWNSPGGHRTFYDFTLSFWSCCSTTSTACRSHTWMPSALRQFAESRGILMEALLIIWALTNSLFSISLIPLKDRAKGMLKFPVTQNFHSLSHFKPRAGHPPENAKHCFHTSLLTKGNVVCWLGLWISIKLIQNRWNQRVLPEHLSEPPSASLLLLCPGEAGSDFGCFKSLFEVQPWCSSFGLAFIPCHILCSLLISHENRRQENKWGLW